MSVPTYLGRMVARAPGSRIIYVCENIGRALWHLHVVEKVDL